MPVPVTHLHPAVMALGSVFLIPNFTFVLEWIAFVAVLAFFARVILPPLRRAMNEREASIRSNIQAAEDARREAAQLVEQRREALEAARNEARQIVDQANEVAEQLKEEGRQRGQAEYERLVQAARSEIELERQRARDEVMGEVGELVLRAAERVIGSGLDGERHRALVDEAIAAAQSSGDGTA
ncbi:MAG TPA: F0F1 ATP synthase subunit B [Acidimicrobiales bacterium]|nr:F0F1 ATP synthase subunit B [Acidimicrobiales bacterium]